LQENQEVQTPAPPDAPLLDHDGVDAGLSTAKLAMRKEYETTASKIVIANDHILEKS
jgi:hypothetical protein